MDRVKRSGKASPLLIAVGPKDKENLASHNLMLKCKNSPGSLKKKGFLKASSKVTNKNFEMIKNHINNIHSDHSVQKKPVTAADLTSAESPGEGYWEQLSESRRIALEATWKENVDLHSKIMQLEYENTKLKAMLSEAKNSIQLLTELIEENESDCEDEDEPCDNETFETETENQNQDDSIEDASFTSM